MHCPMGQVSRTTGRGYTLGTGALPCPRGQRFHVGGRASDVWSFGSPRTASKPGSYRFVSNFLFATRRLRNYGGRLIGINAFHVARIYRRDHVVVSCPVRDCGIRIVHHRDERGIQLRRVRPVRRCSAIHVVAAHRGRACGPRQCHRVWCSGYARARNRNYRRRVRRVARDAHASIYQPRDAWRELSRYRDGLIRSQRFAGTHATGAESRSRHGYS